MKTHITSFPHVMLTLASLAATQARAVDYSWAAPVSGAWGNAANWGTATSPNATDANALIAATGSRYTVTLRNAIKLENLNITSPNATLAHTSGVMSLGGVATLTAGRYYLNGGTISGGTLKQIGGILDIGYTPGNTLDGVTVNGDLAIRLGDGSVRFVNGSVFTGNASLDGTSNTLLFGENVALDDQMVYLNGAGSRMVADGDWTVNIGANGAVYLRGDSTAIDSAPEAGRLRNSGSIIADGTSNTVFITPEHFENAGRIEVRDGSLAQIGDGASNTVLFGESVVDVRDGGVRLGGNWRNEGTIGLANSDLWLGGTFAADDIGTVVRDGTSNTILIGEIDNGGDTWDLAGTTGDVRLDDCTITRCTVKQGDGGRFLFGDGSVRFISDSVIQGGVRIDSDDGSVRFINGSILEGSAIVDGTSNTLLFGEAVTLDDQEFHLNGDGNVLGVDGDHTVTLGADAKVYLRGNGTRIADNIYSDADPALINYGLIEASGPGTRYISIDDFSNRGDIRVNDGAVVEIGDGASNTFLFGESRVALGDGSVRFIGEVVNEGVIEANRSDIAMDGQFIQNDGSVRFINSTISFDVLARIGGGEFRGTGKVLGDTDFTGGTLATGTEPGTLAFNGDLSLTDPSIIEMALGGAAPGTGRILVTGNLDIGDGTLGFGNLRFRKEAGFGEGTYVLFEPGSITGFLDAGDLSGDLGGFTGTLGIVGGDIVLTVVATAPYADWIGGFNLGALGGFDNDPDGDGSPNAVEYFFGTDPSLPTRGLVAGVRNGNRFTFTHPSLRTPGADVRATYRWSKNLTTFLSEGQTDANGTSLTYNVQADTPQPGTTKVTATISGPDAPRLFFRIEATVTE